MQLQEIKSKVSEIDDGFSIKLYDTYVPSPLLEELGRRRLDIKWH